MELAQSILTGIFSILIYGFATLFILLFILEISVTFEKDLSSKSVLKSVATTKILAKKSNRKISKSNENQPYTSKESTVQQLRIKCSQAGIKWIYAIQKPQSRKKRHLNREEMLIALTQIQQSA